MFDASGRGGLREAFRLFCLPLLACHWASWWPESCKPKIDPGITLDWTELRAGDLQGSARSFNE